MGEPQTFTPTVKLLKEEGIVRVSVETEGLTVSFDLDVFGGVLNLANLLDDAIREYDEWDGD